MCVSLCVCVTCLFLLLLEIYVLFIDSSVLGEGDNFFSSSVEYSEKKKTFIIKDYPFNSILGL